MCRRHFENPVNIVTRFWRIGKYMVSKMWIFSIGRFSKDDATTSDDGARRYKTKHLPMAKRQAGHRN